MEWISADDKLPEKDHPVLACDATLDSDTPEVCLYNGNRWYEYASPGWPVDITHWMPLPEPPK